MVTETAAASVAGHRLALSPYARAVGWILLRLLFQIMAGLLATVLVSALCTFPAITSSYGFKMMTAEPFGTDALPATSAIEYFQLVAECLFLVFVLVEFARALVHLARHRHS